MAMARTIVFFLPFVALLASPLALAYDPNPLQDICVADKTSNVLVNGLTCKDPTQTTAADFAFAGLATAGDTANKFGSKVTLVDAQALPGLNTLGIAMARLDIAPYGLNPPHAHPRATEVLTVVEGSMYVGFIAAGDKLFAKVLNRGDVFVFPKGSVHFEFNCGTKNSVGIAGLSSHNPGLVRVADSLFGSSPAVSDDVLAQAFQLDRDAIHRIQARFHSSGGEH